MTITEAARQADQLAAETTSHTFAAISGWSYPASRELLLAMDHFDAFAQANFKNVKPLKRPWKTTERRGVHTELTQDEVIAALRMAGHDLPIPTR